VKGSRDAKPAPAPDIEKRLEELAASTGQTKSFYAREAILAHLDEFEDASVARQRLAAGGARVSLEAIEEEAAEPPTSRRSQRKPWLSRYRAARARRSKRS
jgi:RHH-type rel operon transcriptional repressor/antitoxin RelB